MAIHGCVTTICYPWLCYNDFVIHIVITTIFLCDNTTIFIVLPSASIGIISAFCFMLCLRSLVSYLCFSLNNISLGIYPYHCKFDTCNITLLSNVMEHYTSIHLPTNFIVDTWVFNEPLYVFVYLFPPTNNIFIPCVFG